jgi:hypothetical protein
MDNPQIDAHGTKRWFDANGKFHRDNGPAVEYAHGDKSWYQYGVRHRDDGPAVEYASGGKFWCQHGKWLPFAQWLEEVDISDENKVMMKLKYG